MAGRNIKINQMSSGLPDVSDVLNGWEIPITANYVEQQNVGGNIVDVPMTKLYGVDKFRVQEEIKLKFVSDVRKKILEIFK